MLAPQPRAAPNRLLLERTPAPVVVDERLADREVTGRTDVAAAEAAREKPVGGPSAETAERGELLDDERRFRRAHRVEIERAGHDGAREIPDVLGLSRGVLQRSKLRDLCPSEPRGLGKCPDG